MRVVLDSARTYRFIEDVMRRLVSVEADLRDVRIPVSTLLALTLVYAQRKLIHGIKRT